MKIKSLCFAGVMSVFAADFAQASVCDFNVIQSQRTDASNIFNVCKREAQAGNTEAQFNLGFMYFSGIGVKQNFQDAAKWVRKSAEHGYAQAQDSLGVMYSQGRGVQQSYAEGAKWFRKAAQQGLAGAQYNLGTMYTQGRGVQKNFGSIIFSVWPGTQPPAFSDLKIA